MLFFLYAMLEKNPYFNLIEEENGFLKISKKLENQIIRRQDAPKVFEHVASIYVLSPNFIRKGSGLLSGKAIGYNIGELKSFDVDSELDFELIEYLMKKKYINKKKRKKIEVATLKFTINNKIIAVTGGCGTLGSKYVEEIIKNDAIPIIIDRPQKEPKNFAEIISKKFNSPAYAYECDLTSEKNIISVFSEISNNFGKLDVVINNAAVTGEDLLKFKDKDPFPPFKKLSSKFVGICTKGEFNRTFLSGKRKL